VWEWRIAEPPTIFLDVFHENMEWMLLNRLKDIAGMIIRTRSRTRKSYP
jgi:hypothetical protein